MKPSGGMCRRVAMPCRSLCNRRKSVLGRMVHVEWYAVAHARASSCFRLLHRLRPFPASSPQVPLRLHLGLTSAAAPQLRNSSARATIETEALPYDEKPPDNRRLFIF